MSESDSNKGLNRVLEQAFGERYALSDRLGAGASGVVFRAIDTMLDRDVAIKQIRLDAPHDPEQAQEMKRRAEREAKMAAKLKHPGIVAVHDIAHTETSTLIIMEYVEGTTLESLLKSRRRLELDETVDITAQIADALDHAHTHGVVHRDIKPANLMIDAGGRIKIADFGIAKPNGGGETMSDITATGHVLGTPYYMSPEQARGNDELDGRSDLFSLACVTYECLAGVKPFRGKAVVDILLRIVNADPDGLNAEALDLHPDIEPVFVKALSKKAAARFQTAGELAKALRAVPPLAPRVSVATPVITSRAHNGSSSFDIELQGSLSARSITEIIGTIQSRDKTGILHLQRDELSKRVYFFDGSIVFANSDAASDRFGQFLVRGGVIDDASRDQAIQHTRKTGRRLGETLVALGAVGDDELDALVRDQIRSIIFSVFSWESGHFGFETIENPVEDDIAVSLPTDAILLEGVRTMATESAIRLFIGNTDRVPRLIESPPIDEANISLTSSEGFVLSRVDGTTSVAEMAAISPLGEGDTLRYVCGLIAAGVLRLDEPAGTATTRTRQVRAPEPSPPRKTEPEPRDLADEEDIAAEAERKLAAFEGASHYEVLEVSRGATPDALKKAYHTQAKRFHPDRYRSSGSSTLQTRLERVVSKLSDAYDALSDPSRRLRYDHQLPRLEPVDVDNETNDRAEKLVATPRTPPDVIAEAKYRAGMGYFKDRAYHDAVQNLSEAVRLAPGRPEYHKLLGRVLAKNPKWRKRAESQFQQVLDAAPYDADCYLELALLYEEGGLPTRARRMYEQVVALEPDNEMALQKLDHDDGSEKTTFLKKILRKGDKPHH